MTVARECIDCGEVLEDHYESDTCPFCQGKIHDVVEVTCKECGEIFEENTFNIDSCPYCGSYDIEILD